MGLLAMDKQHMTSPLPAPEQTPKAIGRRLALVRGRCTQEEFADQLGVHVNTLARYERGERLPGTLVYLQLVSRGVDLRWLLTGRRG